MQPIRKDKKGHARTDLATIDAQTLDQKVLAGYQGWFFAEGDNAGSGWRHWAPTTPNPDNIGFDMWPDLREYEDDELYETEFHYEGGANAKLYSAYNPKTVERHVKWMNDYGIDGVFVQRFIGEAVGMTETRDRVLSNIRKGAEKYGRVFANMYDISGGKDGSIIEQIKTDWIHLVDDLQITTSDRYLHHKGKPVLAVWGFGVPDREVGPEKGRELVEWLTRTAPVKYRVTLLGGVNDDWRKNPKWIDVLELLDIISPWAVGRYKTKRGVDKFCKKKIVPDLAHCTSKNIDYMPVIFPGFSWLNLIGKKNSLNQIPRDGGKFFWRQAFNAINAGCQMIYVAMFDEVDESTAIFKVAENNHQTPTTGTFLPLDADGVTLPSDWYLQLMGECSKMLRKEIPLTSKIPIRP